MNKKMTEKVSRKKNISSRKVKRAAAEATAKASADKASEEKVEGDISVDTPDVLPAQPPGISPDEVSVLKNQLLRLQADFENYRKRTARERSDIYKRANEELMEKLLPVMDHMDLALDAAATEGTDNPFLEGFRLIQNQLCDALAKSGLEMVETEGKVFDPNLHEAIAHVPSDDIDENGILAQTRRGFTLGGRLLRAAQVVVSSGPANSSANAGGDMSAEADIENEENGAGEA